MGCKIKAWFGTSCQETICVTAFKSGLFCSPYADGTAAKVTKNFAFVQAVRTPDGLCSEFPPPFLFLPLKKPFFMDDLGEQIGEQTDRSLPLEALNKSSYATPFFLRKSNGCKCISPLIPGTTAVVNTGCWLRVCDDI